MMRFNSNSSCSSIIISSCKSISHSNSSSNSRTLLQGWYCSAPHSSLRQLLFLRSQKLHVLSQQQQQQQIKQQQQGQRQLIHRQLMRSYAAPAFNEEQVKLALQRARKTVGNNLAPVSQIYNYEVYRRIVASRSLYILQNNNCTAAEYILARRELRAAGFTVCAVRNALFRVAMQHHERDLFIAKSAANNTPLPAALLEELENPAIARRSRENSIPSRAQFMVDASIGLMPLRTVIVGPCIAVFSDAEPDGGPSGSPPRVLDTLLKVLGKPALKKLMLVGGAVDREILTPDVLRKVAKMPTKEKMREEVVGLLSSPASQIAGILELNQQMLMATLQARENAK